MKQTVFSRLHVRLPLGVCMLQIGASWLIVMPAGVWVIAEQYVAILGAFLTPTQTWLTALLSAVLAALSLVAHALAHGALARALAGGRDAPNEGRAIPLYPFGDAAQAWPVAASAGDEALAALAGPLTSALLAGIGYLLWNAQLQPFLNVSMPFFGLFNVFLAVVNLAPVFPFDGGRLLRAACWALLGRPQAGARAARAGGYLVAAVLCGWGVFLLAQNARFSVQTGAAALVFAALVLVGAVMPRAWRWEGPEPAYAARRGEAFARTLLVAVIALALLAVSSVFVPTNDGLEAPGVALSVEPMVEVPAQYRHTPSGTFILTSVIAQAPITLGEWAWAKVSPAVNIVPPERIVPRDTTPQEQARQGFQMLDESEISAVVVGMRLAGYKVTATGRGVGVDSVADESPSRDILQAGDLITGIDGTAVHSPDELIRQLAARRAGDTVRLQIVRAGRAATVTTTLMPPAQANGAPRLGITIVSAGFDYRLPFPVRIVPQKIVGGPSAGLMFSLTVYNLLSPTDLTGGRRIAGTGTIDLDGTVGPIGGVQQKVAAAESAGAEYFLSPPDNYADARAVARRIKVIEVRTAAEAVAFLKGLPPADK